MPLRSFLPLVALLLAAPAVAQGGQPQGAVTATIVDAATGAPLPSATLALYAARDTSFATGGAAVADGTVTIDPVRPGSYLARVSFIGYETAQIETFTVAVGAPAALGEIRLAEDAAILDEAEVTAQRDFVEQQADRTVYNVQEQAVTAGGSALETLQTLPSLEVDTDGNISLRGNQNVVIQINGRPTPVRGAFLAALLRQIPADKIERVEVIPNPSAKYEPDGMSGIVNIVLAEGTNRGLSGGFTLGAGTEVSGNAGANLSYQSGDWDLNGQYGLRYGERGVSITSSQRFVNGTPILSQIGLNDNEDLSNFFNGSATYTLSQGTTLSAEGSLGIRSNGSTGLTDFDRTTDGQLVESERATDNDGDGMNGDLALVFRKQFQAAGGGQGAAGGTGGGGRGGFRGGFGGPRGGGGTQGGHELAVETRYTHNGTDGLGLFTDFNTGLVTGLQSQLQDQTNDEASFQVDYTQPLGAGKLEVGTKLSSEWVASDSRVETGPTMDDLVVDPNQTNAFDYDRQIAAVYLQGARGFGPLQVQAGVRAEYARRAFDLSTEVPEAYRQGLDLTETEQDYTSLFPSAFVTYAFEPGSLVKGSYSRRIERPRTFFLNPFPDLSDTTFVRVGTPNLRPEYTDSFELTLQYKFFATLTPFYRRTTDVISRRVFTDAETGVSVFRPGNLDAESNYGADLTLFGQFLGGAVRGFVSSSLYQSVTTDPEPGEADTKALAYDARTSLQLKVREGTEVQLFAFYRGPQKTVDGRRGAFVFSNIGLNQTLSEQLRLSARVNDPFGLAKFEFETNDGVFLRNTEFDPSIQSASFTLTYTFGSNQRRPTQQPQGGGVDDGGFGI
ncbi:TonB-dependent receptor domain-containing protein [Rubrivirga sp. IMCC45206]|uniref:TonB-dependent receptor domain-containing protein n=1 Tax=Rubrivirga sp. IMCC45206 TaxID=3391614 RepID=UPI003990331F